MGWLNGITNSMGVGFGGLQKLASDRKAWHAAVHGVAKIQTRLSDRTEQNWCLLHIILDQDLAQSTRHLALLCSQLYFLAEVFSGELT